MRYREIYERIHSSIMDGKLLAGDRLLERSWAEYLLQFFIQSDRRPI